jgi:hypothetical protein
MKLNGSVGCGDFSESLSADRPYFQKALHGGKTMNNEEVIYAYSRAQAIDDGVLVDVTETAKEAGFKYPGALTRTVWSTYVEVPAGVEGQDEAGRLWDILFMMRHTARGSDFGNVILFELHVRNDNRDRTPPLIELKAVCGPNDDGSPCITVMLPGED